MENRTPCRIDGPNHTGTKRTWAEAAALEQLELGSKRPWDVKTEPTTVRER